MPELDALRGIAVLLVVVYHAFGTPFVGAGPSPAWVRLASFGWVGVDLFFVLSGFLITGILMDQRGAKAYYGPFYTRRVFRIWPAYFAVLIGLLAVGRIGWDFAAAATLFVANFAPVFGVAVVYGPLWTLAVEEHFYLFWPLVVRQPRRWILVAASLAVVAANMAFRAIAYADGTLQLQHHYTQLTSDGLAVGALFAVLARAAGTRTVFTTSLSCAALAAIGLVGLALSGNISQSGSWVGAILTKTLVAFGFAGVLGLALVLRSSGAAIAPAWLRFFGWISYSLYLIYVAVNEAYDYGVSRLAPQLHATVDRFDLVLLRAAVTTALAVAVSFAMRRYLEQPFIRMGARLAGRESGGSRVLPQPPPI